MTNDNLSSKQVNPQQISQDLSEHLKIALEGINKIYNKKFDVEIKIHLEFNEEIEEPLEFEVTGNLDTDTSSQYISLDPEQSSIQIKDVTLVINPKLWDSADPASKVYVLFTSLGNLLDSNYLRDVYENYSKLIYTIRKDLVDIAYSALFFLIYTDVQDPEDLSEQLVNALGFLLQETWDYLLKGLVSYEDYARLAIDYGLRLAYEALDAKDVRVIHEKALKDAIELINELASKIIEKSKEKKPRIVYIV
jgi:hypothetical protein